VGEIEELRQVVREAHEVLGDLRRERREVERLVAGIRLQVQESIAARLSTEVEEAMRQLAEATDQAMRESVARVEQSFDRLAATMMGRRRPDVPSIDEIGKVLAYFKARREAMPGAAFRPEADIDPELLPGNGVS
jgi:ribosomal protein S13